MSATVVYSGIEKKFFTLLMPGPISETRGGSFVSVSNIDDEPTLEQRLALIQESGAFAFWDRPGEDIYTLEDGEPL